MKPLYLLISQKSVVIYDVLPNLFWNIVGDFSNTEEGVTLFSTWLSLHQDKLFYIVLDGFKEIFHVENIPPVWGDDQRAIIQRRFNQFARDTIYRYAYKNSSWLTHFRNERIQYILSAIPENHIIDPWLECIEKYKCPLIGIFSVSSLMNQFLKKRIDWGTSPTVLMCTDENKALRQFLFVKGKLFFYRVNSEPKEGWAVESLNVEMQRSSRYFSGSINASASIIRFWYVYFNDNDNKKIFFEKMNNDKVKIFHAKNIFGNFNNKNKTTALQRPISKITDFFIIWLANNKITNHYAPPYRLYYKTLYYFNSYFKKTVLIISSFLIIFLIFVWKSYASIHDEYLNLYVQNKDLSVELSYMNNTSYENMDDQILTSDIYNLYNALMHRPRIKADMLYLSEIFKKMNYDINLENIKWSVDDEHKNDVSSKKTHLFIKGNAYPIKEESNFSDFYDDLKDNINKKYKVVHWNIKGENDAKKTIRTKLSSSKQKIDFEMDFDYSGLKNE
ncbi:MAG: hypothetical protein V4525_11625 [Pseudomonadota bacterium]